MDKYIIFSTPMVWVLLSVIAAIYVADTVLNRFICSYQKQIELLVSKAQNEQINKIDYYNAASEFQKISSFSFRLAVIKFISAVITLCGIGLHIWEIVLLLSVKAKPEEVLFLLMISIALALTSNGLKREEK